MNPNNFKQIKAIVFDLDDTLYPQVAYKRSGFRVVSAWVAHRCKMDQSMLMAELESILKQYGPSYPNMFDRLVERLNLNHALVDELVRIFVDHEPQINCFDGVIPMLKRLGSKYRLGILTDGRLSVQQKKLESLGLKRHVDEILCSDMLGMEKPAPELFQWFEKKFGLNGEALMYVGDNPIKDFYGANSRNWSTAMVMTGNHCYDEVNPSSLPDSKLSNVVDLGLMI